MRSAILLALALAGAGCGGMPAMSTSQPAMSTREPAMSTSQPALSSSFWQDQPETDAHRDRGTVYPPGPDAIGDHEATCDAAHNHCLHGNTWFVTDFSEQPTVKGYLAYRFEGRFYSWNGDTDLTDMSGDWTAIRTVPATAATAKPGTIIALYVMFGDLTLPTAASQAREGEYWPIGKVGDVDAAAGMFRFDGGEKFYPLSNARTAVETQPM